MNGRRQTSHLGSTISNKSESVVRSQTSYAFVVLNSDIQSGLKSSIEFASPPIFIHPSNQHLHEKKGTKGRTRPTSDQHSTSLSLGHKITVFDGSKRSSDVFLELSSILSSVPQLTCEKNKRKDLRPEIIVTPFEPAQMQSVSCLITPKERKKDKETKPHQKKEREKRNPLYSRQPPRTLLTPPLIHIRHNIIHPLPISRRQPCRPFQLWISEFEDTRFCLWSG